jgi:addiction module RelE/StbE family toxin
VDIKVKWSPEAIKDIEAIAEYIARDSEYYAQSVVTEVLTAARNASRFPLMGRIVPEIHDKCIREILIYSYRLIYLVDTDSILIVAVIHAQRQLKNIQDRLD